MWKEITFNSKSNVNAEKMLFLMKASDKMRKEKDSWSLFGCGLLEVGGEGCKRTAVVTGLRLLTPEENVLRALLSADAAAEHDLQHSGKFCLYQTLQSYSPFRLERAQKCFLPKAKLRGRKKIPSFYPQ